MFFHDLKRTICTRLLSDEFFTLEPHIPVLPDDKEGLEGAMNAAMARLGLCVLVAALGGRVANPDIRLVRLEPVRLVCRVRENPALNRSSRGTRQPADYVAQVAARLLHLHAGEGMGSPLVVESIEQGEDLPGIFPWDVLLSARMSLGTCAEASQRLDWRDRLSPLPLAAEPP